MSTRSVPPSVGEADYDAIEAAVMETARGRWFLAEFARRNRTADTDMLLDAIERLAAVARGDEPAAPDPRIRGGLRDMAKAIADTKADIAALEPEAAHGGLDEASGELGLVVQATETATSDILAAAEHVQEAAWTLREQGVEAGACDFLDAQATAIYTACSFQDLTGQRTRKVIEAMRYMEGRIDAMMAISGSEPAAVAPTLPDGFHARTVVLLDAPAKRFQGLDQIDIDVVMRRDPCPAFSAHGAANVTALVTDYPPTADPFPALALDENDEWPEAWSEELILFGDEQPAPSVVAEAFAPESADGDAQHGSITAAPRADAQRDPLAPIRALSYEEKIALFS